MPSIDDLNAAVAANKTAIDAAAQRVIDATANPVPQESLDAINAGTEAANAILPS